MAATITVHLDNGKLKTLGAELPAEKSGSSRKLKAYSLSLTAYRLPSRERRTGVDEQLHRFLTGLPRSLAAAPPQLWPLVVR
jgi:hypothetical protein